MKQLKVTREKVEEAANERCNIAFTRIETVGVDSNGNVWLRVAGGALVVEQGGYLTIWTHRELEESPQVVELKPNMSIEIIVRE